MKGKFIVFEGIDGCGKGTQLKKVASFLFDYDKNIDLFLTKEPTRDFKEIRERLAQGNDVNKDARWYTDAFVKDRINHVDKYIVPALNNGTHVLCDRYKHSTLAYQNLQGISFEELNNTHQGILIPDLIFIFDCPAEIAFERRKNSGATDVFDKDLEFQKQLRTKYLELKEKLHLENIKIINADRDPKEIFEDVKKEILELISKN